MSLLKNLNISYFKKRVEWSDGTGGDTLVLKRTEWPDGSTLILRKESDGADGSAMRRGCEIRT